MKAKWLKKKTTGVAKYVYTVTGSTKEIAQYIENQGEYCRFLQDDDSITDEESTTPVFYSMRNVGKNPVLRWDADNERYRADVTFEDTVLMDAVTAMYTPQNDSVKSKSDNVEEDEDSVDEDAETKAKSKSKPTSTKKKLS